MTFSKTVYRIRLNGDADVESIFDKAINKELLSAPARLPIVHEQAETIATWNP